MNNFWVLKKKEKSIIKVIEWAHKNKKKIELLTSQEILQALKEDK